jgi:hypothetical protein
VILPATFRCTWENRVLWSPCSYVTAFRLDEVSLHLTNPPLNQRKHKRKRFKSYWAVVALRAMPGR